jgi:hypothetical protein
LPSRVTTNVMNRPSSIGIDAASPSSATIRTRCSARHGVSDMGASSPQRTSTSLNLHFDQASMLADLTGHRVQPDA